MGVTFEQARTLDAVARHGSFAKAAPALGKRHSAILYTLKTLERDTGLRLLDRTQYRTGLTPAGKRVWEECKRILEVEREFNQLCDKLGAGWEPYLRIILEGVLPFEPVLRAIEALSKQKVPTRIQVFADHHRGVEESFAAHDADVMISILPPEKQALEPTRIDPVRSLLVAEKDHPLVQGTKTHTIEDLRSHLFITVRGSDSRLTLSTSALDPWSAFHLNDFASKKATILRGVGFGWMPEYLVSKELDSGRLKVVRWEKPSLHVFRPNLFHRGRRHLGRAGHLFVDEYLKTQGRGHT